MTTVTVGQVVAEVVGEGTAVVMIHGLGGTSNMFQPQMAALSGYRVIRLDLPGSGRSPRPIEQLTIEGMSEAVIRAMVGMGSHPRISSVIRWAPSSVSRLRQRSPRRSPR